MAHQVVVTRLSSIEKQVYTLLAFGITLITAYVTVNETLQFKNDYFMLPSWTGLPINRDSTDLQWRIMNGFLFVNFNILWIFSVIPVDLIARRFIPQFQSQVLLVYSMAIFVKLYTVYGFAFMFVLSLIMYVSAKLFNSKIVIWSTLIAIMFVSNTDFCFQALKSVFLQNGKTIYEIYMYRAIMLFTFLRIVSFCIDKIDLEKKMHELKEKDKMLSEDRYSFINLQLYTFYLSFSCVAPFVTFQNFYKAFTNERASISLKEALILASRVLFSAFLVELALHFTVVYAIHSIDFEFSSGVMNFGTLLFKGALFTTRYVYIYGLPTLINQVVGMKTTPLPRCILMIHTGGELWKYFDTGIYEFIKNYLYIPLGGSRISTLRKIFSSVLSFIFVSIWHGETLDVQIWSLGNFLIVFIEGNAANFIVKNKFMQKMSKNISESNKRRLICLLMAFWQLILYIVAFFFLSDLKVTYRVYKRLLFDDFPNGFLLIYIFYYSISHLRLDLIPLKV